MAYIDVAECAEALDLQSHLTCYTIHSICIPCFGYFVPWLPRKQQTFCLSEKYPFWQRRTVEFFWTPQLPGDMDWMLNKQKQKRGSLTRSKHRIPFKLTGLSTLQKQTTVSMLPPHTTFNSQLRQQQWVYFLHLRHLIVNSNDNA